MNPSDRPRLARQHDRILAVVQDGQWHTLAALQATFSDISGSSLTARLRDLRRPEHGGYIVEQRVVSGRGGLREYRVLPGRSQESSVRLSDHDAETDRWYEEAF